ncbi:DMT family transporter [Ferrimicrobium sp.]|uniref:EamA family transporter n=1 Tax=Ferrimicrobium sp. TaxID=2926050 RepID=UPI0026395F25|nr:DMT family transporter [Ferrimicrobium sp.]
MNSIVVPTGPTNTTKGLSVDPRVVNSASGDNYTRGVHPHNVRQRPSIIGIVTAAILWGFSGIAAQQLFQHYHLAPTWLAAVRVTGAGVLLALWAGPRGRSAGLRRLGADWRKLATIIIFGVVALDGVQLTFFLAIAHGSAVSATLLQFTSPVLILGWISLRHFRVPKPLLMVLVASALAGVALVVTDGSTSGLAIPLAGIVWGLTSALFTAFYNLLPAELLAHHNAEAVVASAFLIGSVVLLPWLILDAPTTMTMPEIGLVIFIIVGGTAVPFLLYLSALANIAPLLANVVGTLEPLTAAVASIFLFNLRVSVALIVGVVLVLGSVIGLSLIDGGRQHSSEPPQPPSIDPSP